MNNTFSANMLKTFEECPQKYIFQYIENIQIPQSTKTANRGKNIHALINYYFNGFNTNKIIESLDSEEKNLWKNFLKLNIKKEDIYKSEYTFNIKIYESNWLTGRIDAIVKEKEKYIIYDWKTGTIPKTPRTDLQTCIYLLSLYKILKNKKLISNIEDLSFIYTNLNTNESTEIRLSSKEYKDLENLISSIISGIESCIAIQRLPNKKPEFKTDKECKNKQENNQCQKCKYKTIC